jgi:membrane protease YdiL (CAAX protease family)
LTSAGPPDRPEPEDVPPGDPSATDGDGPLAGDSRDTERPLSPIDTRPGLGTFTIEGRAAPGLFVGGWIATLVGFAIVIPWFASGGTVPLPLLIVGLVLVSLGLVGGAGSQAIERRARGATYAGPSPFLLFVAVIPISILLDVAALVVLGAFGLKGDSPAIAVVSTLILLAIYVGLIRLAVVGTAALSWREVGLRLPEPQAGPAIAMGVLIAVPLVYVTALLLQLLLTFLPAPPSPLPEATDRVGLLLNLVAAAFIAPVGEELFFRGFATTAWLRSIGPRGAILRGGLFFAFAHVLTLSGSSFEQATGQAVVAFVVRLPVAFVLGWLFVRTRSIYPTIALHATFNGLPLLLLLLHG